MPAGLPKVSATSMPRVRLVAAFSALRTSMFSVAGSASTNTGRAPTCSTAFTLLL